ncbi:MAG: hypothetical protein WCI73_05780, partial [Phycisphaerae bacterium]
MSQTPLHTIAWQGCSLQIPDGLWNLTRYQGNAQLGLCALADLTRELVEIKWRQVPPRRIETQATKLVERLRRRHEVSSATLRSSTGSAELRGWWVRLPPARAASQTRILLLIQAPSRLYELTGHSRAILETAARGLRDHTAEPFWPWELYGLRGRVPRAMVLRQIILQPGRTQLDFLGRRSWRQVVPGRGGEKISLGSWSLADRLLAGQPLRQWAQKAISLVRQHGPGTSGIDPGPQDSENGEVQETFEFPQRSPLLRRPRRIILQLTHDPAANIIHWLQVSGSPA